jgi:hypothetical protein
MHAAMLVTAYPVSNSQSSIQWFLKNLNAFDSKKRPAYNDFQNW